MAAKVRETGIAAIGAIPVSWKLERLNNVAELFGRIGWQGLTSDEYTDEGAYLVTGTDFRDGYIDWSSCVHVSEDRWEEAWQIKLQEGDLLISKDGTIGKLAIVSDLPGHASLNSGLMRIVPRSTGYITKYLYYVLQTDVFYDWYREIDAGASTIKHLFQGDFIHFVYPSPPIEEQEAIAEELDKRTKELDHAINLVSRQLETLDGYRKSLIQETVTKGLDLTVDMKPSGYEYLGSIPSTWGMSPLLYLGEMQNGISKDGDSFGSGYPFVSYGDVYRNVFLPRAVEGLVESNSEERYRYSVKKNDAFFTRTSETIDEIGFASVCLESIENATFAGFLIRFRPNTCKLNMRFAAYYFRSENLRAYFAREMVSVTRASLSQNLLGRLVVPLPPLDEQERIANYLDSKYSVVDRLIAGKRKQLETLRAQRQSLIYEYVTGKRRVV